MERGLSLLIATVILFVASSVQAQNNLPFGNNTQFNITQNGCGSSKLCIAVPSQCDPAGNSSCLFTSVTASNTSAPRGTDLSFELSGNSTGYIALGLTVNSSQGITAIFLCGQNSSSNGTFFFRTLLMNNTNAGTLFPPPPSSLPNASLLVQGKITSTKIQCLFTLAGVNATTLTRIDSSTIFTVLLGTGTINGSSIGPFTTVLNSGPLNLADPRANIVSTTVAPTVTNATTNATINTTAPTGAGVTLHLHAMTLLLGVLTLCFLMMA